MDKTILLEQLGEKLRVAVQQTHRSSEEARQDARTGAARAVNLAQGQAQRSVSARTALDALNEFRVRPLGRNERIGLGAVVEVEGEEEGGRTLFIAPVGAGTELSGPGGDGLLQVVTPASPFGKALMGKKVGDVVDVVIAGQLTEWTIAYAE